MHRVGIAIGLGQDEVGVGDRFSNSPSPRSESWSLKELDVASTDLRNVFYVPGIKKMLRTCGGEASTRGVGLACQGSEGDKEGTQCIPGLEKRWQVRVGGAGAEIEKVVPSKVRAGVRIG